MISLFGVTVVLYFTKIFSGSRNYSSVMSFIRCWIYNSQIQTNSCGATDQVILLSFHLILLAADYMEKFQDG